MDTRIAEWKQTVERLATQPDYRKLAQLLAEIAQSDIASLREAAAQIMPSVRQAGLKGADRATRAIALRRLETLRNALHALSGPRFGRRGRVATLSPQERYREMLGLPQGRRLFGPEIKDAYKRAAKRYHPDVGGSEQDFRALSEARDALIRDL